MADDDDVEEDDDADPMPYCTECGENAVNADGEPTKSRTCDYCAHELVVQQESRIGELERERDRAFSAGLEQAARDVCMWCGGRAFPNVPELHVVRGPNDAGNFVHGVDDSGGQLCAATSIHSRLAAMARGEMPPRQAEPLATTAAFRVSELTDAELGALGALVQAETARNQHFDAFRAGEGLRPSGEDHVTEAADRLSRELRRRGVLP